jgi:predicted RNase H-like nuclease (RuvC/YqgF family)
MIIAVVLLWACGIAAGSCVIPGEPWLPTLKERFEQAQKAAEERQPWSAKAKARHEFVRRWLELRMEKETAERLERAQSALAERPTAQDAERKAFIKRWLELRMEKEKAAQAQ